MTSPLRLCVRRSPAPDAEGAATLVTLRLPSDVTCIEEAVELVTRHCLAGHAATRTIRFRLQVVLSEALANAMPYMQAFGHAVIAWMWLDVALCAQARLDAGAPGDAAHEPVLRGKLAACRFFFHYELPKIGAWLRVVETRDDTCRTMEDAWF